MSVLPAVASALFGAPAAAAPPPQEHTPTAWHTDPGPGMQLPYAHTARTAPRVAAAAAVAPSPSTASGPDAAYPRLAPIWARIRSWSRRQFPELADTLNGPAPSPEVAEFERLLRQPLPPAVKESFALVNGQDNESLSDGALARARVGLVLGLPLLSVQEAMAEWTYWRHVDSDPSSGANDDVRSRMASCPAGWVVPQYSHPGWVPLVSDRMGNYIGVDLSPPSPAPGAPPAAVAGHGQTGQVIIFGRDFDTTIVLHPGDGKGGWAHFLASLADMLERGTFFALDGDDAEEASDEEDYIGYEGYFGGSTGANAVGGGPASAHLGGYGFRLCKPYKGVGVMHALADQSAKHWEQMGFVRGMSPVEVAWRQVQAESESTHPELEAPYNLDEHQEQVLYGPLDSVRYPSAPGPVPTHTRRWSELDHPLSPLSETGMSTRSSLSTSTETDSGIATPRRRAPPPQSSDFLALPTLEDVESVREDELRRALGDRYRRDTVPAKRSSLFAFTLPWTPKAALAQDVEAEPHSSAASSASHPWSFFPRSSPSTRAQDVGLDLGLPHLSSSRALFANDRAHSVVFATHCTVPASVAQGLALETAARI